MREIKMTGAIDGPRRRFFGTAAGAIAAAQLAVTACKVSGTTRQEALRAFAAAVVEVDGY
jgi:hypothetical protein